MAIGSVDPLAPQDYDPRLYAPAAEIEPLAGWEAWTPAMDAQYRELGFVSVGGAFDDATCDATIAALLELADGPPREGLEIAFEHLAAEGAERLPIEQRQDQIRKYMWFVRHDERFDLTARHPALMEVVGRLLGAEPELFQDMALFKPPGIGREKPWHQDHAYFDLPEGTPVVGVWIALDAASLENGCMVFQPGGHRQGAIAHVNRRDWQICDADILAGGRTVAAPLPRGGCLVFDGLTPHGTPMNRSAQRRRAAQYHFIPRGTPRISREDRMRLFGDPEREVTC